VSGLLICPFCRAFFPAGETQTCPDCELPLVPAGRLARSAEAAPDSELDPLDRPAPFWSGGRGRGALALVAALGLLAFWLPWVVVTSPYQGTLSGFDLARGGSSWLWGGATGWLVLIPLALTRRTPRQMRGVRAVATAFAALTAIEAVVLWTLSPTTHPLVPFRYSWGYGLYASALWSALGVGASLRLGGGTAPVAANPGPSTRPRNAPLH
jgi:hypothetical protein